MSNKLRKIIFRILRDITPPVIFKLFYREKQSPYGFSGDYANWEEVIKLTSGYDNNIILEKVKEAILKVKKGEAASERDSCTFDKIYYSWPVLTGLFKVALENEGKLRVLDFGGSLGSHYFQNKDILNSLNELKWGIVEQNNFVDCGRNYIQDDNLRFYFGVNECILSINPNVVIISNVLQYLEDPYETLEEILNKNISYIILDATALNIENRDILTLQKVPPEVYEASYPAWFLNEEKLLKLFENKYDLIADFDSIIGGANIPSKFKGYIFKRRILNA